MADPLDLDRLPTYPMTHVPPVFSAKTRSVADLTNHHRANRHRRFLSSGLGQRHDPTLGLPQCCPDHRRGSKLSLSTSQRSPCPEWRVPPTCRPPREPSLLRRQPTRLLRCLCVFASRTHADLRAAVPNACAAAPTSRPAERYVATPHSP